MTVLIGTVYQEGVILAADSQVEASAGVDYKRTDAVKLYSFQFEGASVAIGGADQVRVTDRIIEIFEQTAKGKTFHTAREVEDTLEDAVRSVMDKYFTGPGVHPPDEARNFTMLMGVCCGTEKATFSVGDDAMSERDNHYTATGSGEPIAEYLLSKLSRTNEYDLDFALRVALTVIENVKSFDTHCGGATPAVVLKGHEILPQTTEEINEVLQLTHGIDTVIQMVWWLLGSPKTQKLFLRLWNERMKDEMEKVQSKNGTPP